MPDTKTTDATSGRTTAKEPTADAEPLTVNPPEDTRYVDDVRTQRGRSHPTPFGSGEPGEPETFEQGMVRTGRQLPAHNWDEDSAGLVPEVTEARKEKSRTQRAETMALLEDQGNAADGDSKGPRVRPRPGDESMKAKEREARK